MSVRSSPYVGLEPYSVDDESIFFGRDRERRTIASNLRGARLTLLYGPSGVGKSSVLGAGVSYDLQQLALENQKNYGSPEFIVIVFSSWQDDPVKVLVRSIAEAASKFPRKEGRPAPKEASLVKSIEAWSDELNSDFLIILDQFEDYFPRDKSESSRLFAKEFSDAVNSPSLRANFLVSIREDALPKLDVFKEQIPGLFENYLRIENLSIKEAKEAIVNPVEVYNKETQASPEYSVEPELVDEVGRQIVVGKIPSGRTAQEKKKKRTNFHDDLPIETTLLQIVMKRIWDEEKTRNSPVLRLKTLEQLGNTAGIVKNHLEAQMNDLSEGDKDVAADIFYYLVTPSGRKMAHTVGDLAVYASGSESELEPVLERLASARVLRKVPYTVGSHSVARFEIFHEVFAPAVLDWSSRYTLEDKTRAMHAKLRRYFFLVLAITVVFSLFFSYGTRQKRKAEAAEADARKAKENTETQVRYRNQLENEIPFSFSVMRGHSASVNKAVFSPVGDLVATASEDLTARLWTASSGVERRQLQLNEPATDISFNSNGTLMAIANANHITLWDPATGVSTTLEGHAGKVRKVAFWTKDPGFLASGDELGVTIVWDVRKQIAIQRPSVHSGAVNDVEWSSQTLQLVTAGDDSTARVWDVSTGKPVQIIRHDRNQSTGSPVKVNTAVFSPDGKEILTAGDDWTATVWNAKTGQFIRWFRGHDGVVHSAEFGDAGTILTASADRTARVWNVNGKDILVLAGHSDEVLGAHFSPDRTRVITWSKDRTARVWDASAGKSLLELRAHIRPVSSAEFSKHGRLVVTASEDYTARVWNIGDVRALTVTEVKVSSIEGAGYSGDCTKSFVRVFGKVSVAGAAGIVKYRFVLNGRAGPERSLDFDGPGSKEVGGTYKFKSSMSGMVYLEITSPSSTDLSRSEPERFRVTCKAPAPAENKSSPAPTPP